MERGRIAFVANGTDIAEDARAALAKRHGNVPPRRRR